MGSAGVIADPRLRAWVLVPGLVLVVAGWTVLSSVRGHGSPPSFAVMWVAMTIAMMLPTATRPMMRAADGSIGRAWAFVAGFALPWLLVGAPTYLVMNAVEWTPFWIAATWAAAGAYQLTPLMRRTLTTCRSIRFDGDPSRYGVRQGLRCVASCWPVMLAAMVTVMSIPGTVLPMVGLLGLTALLCWEKSPSAAPRAVAAVGMTMLLLAAGGFVVLGGGVGAGHHASGTSRS